MGWTEAITIPHFYLYEDSCADVDMDFLHAEPIRDRSGAHGWTIRAHAHPDHIQLLSISQGGGWIRVEECRYDVTAPAFVVIPLASVHDMAFAAGTDGEVMTIAKGYLSEPVFAVPSIQTVLGKPMVLGLGRGPQQTAMLHECFVRLRQEFVWQAPCRRQAITGLLLNILVHAVRLGEAAPEGEQKVDRNYVLLHRFRALLEQDFRAHKRLEHYAGALGVTVPRLNLACKARAGKVASKLLHDRIIIEAKRSLLYSGLSVAGVAHQLGFDDPAYFNRFFSQRVGRPPAAYREKALLQR